MKNPNPVNLQASADVRKAGWQAETRDADGHLCRTHVPFDSDDQIVWLVREAMEYGETVTIWPRAVSTQPSTEAEAPQRGQLEPSLPPAPISHVVGFDMTDEEIRQWIVACNHEPAKASLRHYLALRTPAAPPDHVASPTADQNADVVNRGRSATGEGDPVKCAHGDASQLNSERTITGEQLSPPNCYQNPPIGDQEWCQPGDIRKRQFLVTFDDPDCRTAVFDDENEAREFWGRACLNWNCYLFGAIPVTPPPAEKMRGIYIASKTKHADRWRQLRDAGLPIISTWIDEAGPGESGDLSDLWRRCILEASSASALVLYREPEDVLKGGWVELGAALASGVPVFAVGIEDFTIANDKRIRHFAELDDAIAATFEAVNSPRRAPVSHVVGTEGRRGDWMQTVSGRQFWPLDPRPEDVFIEDIAHALSMMCRFNGHCERFYSVAEHSVLVSENVPPEDALWALLHDASEAYIADIVRPAKRFIDGYKQMEGSIMAAVCGAFDLPYIEPPSVKRADNAILADEAAQIMGTKPKDWILPEPPLGVRILGLSPTAAKQAFLTRYRALTTESKS